MEFFEERELRDNQVMWLVYLVGKFDFGEQSSGELCVQENKANAKRASGSPGAHSPLLYINIVAKFGQTKGGGNR